MKRLFTWILLLCWAAPAFAQWEYTQGPENFSITRMASIGDSIFCLNGGKIQVSKDGPISWQPYMQGIPADVSILELRKNADMLIAVGNSQPYFLLKGSNTWKSITKGLPAGNNFTTLYTFDNEHIFLEFYLESNYFVYKLNWTEESWIALPILENTYKLAFAYDPSKGFLAAYDRVDTNDNYEIYLANSANGIDWNAKNTTEIDSLDFGYLMYHDSLIFASNYDAELLQSSDFGLTWKKLNPNIELLSESRFHSQGESLFLVTAGGIYLSQDNGQSFEVVVEDFFLRASSPVQFTENSVYYVSFGIPGLALVEDGFWFQTDIYFPAHFVARGYQLTDERVLVYGLGGCFDLSAEDESELLAINGLPTVSLATTQVSTGKELFATTAFSTGLYHYDLNTKVWSVAMDSLDFPYLPVEPTFAAKGDSTLMASYLGIYHWNSANKVWSLLDDAPFVSEVANLKANDRYFYGLIDEELYIWKGGQNEWESISLPAKDFFADILDVIFKGDTLFYLDEDRIAFSTDLGNNWTELPTTFGSLRNGKFLLSASKLYITAAGNSLIEVSTKNVSTKQLNITNAQGIGQSIENVFVIDDLFFAQTDNGESTALYVSNNVGGNWAKVNLPKGLSLVYNGTSVADQFYFATEKGVWSIPKSALGLLTSDKSLQDIKLANFFPNPSKGKFSLQTALTDLGNAPVQVNVFNTFGQKIRSYTSQLNGSTLEIDLSDANNGVYFIFLQAGSKAWKSQVVKTN